MSHSLPKLGMMLSLALAAAALGFGAYRVYSLERAELEVWTVPHTLREFAAGSGATKISAPLAATPLSAGTRAIFELCADDGLQPARWQGAIDVAVINASAKKLMLRVPLDAAHLAHVQRNSNGGCLLLGSGLLDTSGNYTVDAVWQNHDLPSAVATTPLRVHILGKPELARADRNCVLSFGLAMLAWLGFVVFERRSAPSASGAAIRSSFETVSDVAGVPDRASMQRIVIALLASATIFLASELPLFGSTFTLLKGGLLLLVQAGLPVLIMWLAQRSEPAAASVPLRERAVLGASLRERLAFITPDRHLRALALAVCAWPLLVASAKAALMLVPSTGEAPIETFVSWPSGMLSAALLGIFLPIGEELFFRGYLYGALLPRGRALAALCSVSIFTALHAQQSWGNWGGLVSVALAGIVLTGLRVFTGSTLVCALTHVSYNLSLSVLSLYRS